MKVIKRICFHFRDRTQRSFRKWRIKLKSNRSQKEYIDMNNIEDNISPDEIEEMKKMFEDKTTAPKIDQRRTMLFLSRPEEHDCDFVTAPKYRKNILLALQWAQEHGISTFVVDYTTPLGILALETLLDERKKGAEFNIYTIRSTHVALRRTYRLVKETPIELAILTSSGDYHYTMQPDAAALFMFSQIAIHFTEAGCWLCERLLTHVDLKALRS